LDYFEWICRGITKQKEAGWPAVSIISMPYKSFEIKLEESQEHKFPAHELILPWLEQPRYRRDFGKTKQTKDHSLIGSGKKMIWNFLRMYPIGLVSLD